MFPTPTFLKVTGEARIVTGRCFLCELHYDLCHGSMFLNNGEPSVPATTTSCAIPGYILFVF